jgi:hypothetical protein
MLDRPIFVVGCGRSGTTVLRLILDAHPDVAIPGESNFIPHMWRNRRKYQWRGSLDVDSLLRDIFEEETVQRMGVSSQAAREHLKELQDPTLSDVFALPFIEYARQRGKKRWGDKTPIYVRSISVLARIFPQARFIHLIRDGHNVALSYLAFPPYQGDIWDVSARWRSWVSAGVRAGRALGRQRYVELRYEDLVAEPVRSLEMVCSFLGLAFDPVMLDFHVEAPGRLQAPSDHEAYHARTSSPLEPSSRDWRTEMSDRDCRIFEATAGHLLSRLGYQRRYAALPWSLRAEAEARYLMDRMRVAGSRAKKSCVRSAARFVDRTTPASSP